MIRWEKYVAHGEMTNTQKSVVGNPERKRPLGRTRRRFEDNIKFNIKKNGSGGYDWIHLPQYKD